MRRFLPLLAAALLAHAADAQSFAAPEPVGGNNAVKWLLEQELTFPPAALEAEVDGNVGLEFMVRADGSIADLHVLHPLRPDCDAEALRIARMIRWVPASVGGSLMDKEHELAIPFNAKKYKKAHAKAQGCPKPTNGEADASGRIYKDREVDSLAAPLVKGGLRGLPAYLSENLKYPEEAFRRDIQGKVTLEFVVEASGSISNLRTTEPLGAGCDDEAMRLIRSTCWRPAIAKGQRVRSLMKLDIQFRLDPSKRP
ncbi:MAG: energy transducer TonB [Flavobacteriales bacterium]